MKCICPMGGDRNCPDNCFIAGWHRLPDDQKTKERRRPIVEQLSKQGYTQEAIALQLGVSHQTVGRDLETLSIVDNVKGQGKDTLGRKRSTGRPTGKTNKRGKGPSPKQDEARDIVREKLEANEPISPHKLQAEHGISHVTFDMAITAELARREAIAENTVRDPSFLSKTAHEKLDIAIRLEKKRLASQFEAMVRAEVDKRLENLTPLLQKEQDEAKRVMKARYSIFDKPTFNLIRSCLHPDSRHSASDAKLNKAFHAFMALEKLVLNEEDSPTTFTPLPRMREDWDKAKREASAARKAKYAASRNKGGNSLSR